MANKISFIIELQNRFSRAAKKINRQMVSFGTNATKAALLIKTKLAASFKKLRSVATGAFLAITASATLAFRKIITSGAAFQDSIADLSAITGASGDALKKLTTETFRLSRAASISQVKVAGAFTQIASAKSELLKDPKGLSIVTEQVLLLANAAGIAVPDAVRASVGALNQFNKGADQAARFVNVIAAGAKIGSSLVGETAEALKNVGSVAAQFNVSFEETNALIQTLAKNEIKGAEAGTALRGTLSKLEGFMKGRLAPSKVGIIKSLEMIEKLGLSNVQVIKEFGLENLRSILILRKNIPLIRQFTKELTGTNVAQEQASIRLGTFNAKMRKLGVTLNESVIKTFNKLEPALLKQGEAFGKWIESFSEKDIESLASVLSLLANTFGLLGKALALVAKGINVIGRFSGEALAGLVGHIGGRDINLRNAELRTQNIREEINSRRAASQENLVSAAQSGGSATIKGEIVLKASPGTEVISSKIKTQSKSLNFGLNLLPGAT